MNIFDKRLTALEALQPSAGGTWHRLVWGVGQSWTDVLAAYNNGARIRPGDSVILRKVVSAEGGMAVFDPVIERDTPVASAWLAERIGR